MLNSNNDRSFVRPLIQYMEQYHKLSNSLIAQYEKHCSLVIVRKNKHIVSPVDSNAALFL